MSNKIYLIAALALTSLTAAAQETYQATKMVGNELNGTARYVGMGGAMEALGADLSTMGTNPAGIGLFRSSQLALSGGFVTQSDATTHPTINGMSINFKGDKTNASFDQVGFVWSRRTGVNSFLNLGFNYHKSRNFDQILTAGAALNNASQNKLTAMKHLANMPDQAWNAVDAGYYKIMGKDDNSMGYLNGTGYIFGQYQHGYIGQYDINISGNINNRVFLGATFGIHDVHYHSQSIYSEDLENNMYTENNERLDVTGTGFDVKAGIIFRPIENSPFRIGAYVNSPVMYDLQQDNSAYVHLNYLPDDKIHDAIGPQQNGATLSYRLNTPWKFGVSLGHTVDKYLALGLTYEYSDYKKIDNRYIDGGYYDYYGTYYTESSSDEEMNNDTRLNLKGVHTLKLGLEYKPIENLALRAGYNYVSPVFNKKGYRDVTLSSQGVAYATSTDYTNWGATNRMTLGAGWTMGKVTIDLAYQATRTDGTFYPFMPSYAENANETDKNNVPNGAPTKFMRHQVLGTLTWRF